jgi:hypothetical protein
MSARRALGLLLLVLIAGLGVIGFDRLRALRTDAGPPPTQRSLRVQVRPIRGLSVAARVEVAAPGATDVVVRYGQGPNYGTETPRFPISASGNLSTTVIGLPAAATSHLRVVARYEDGSARTSEDLTVTTPPLEPSVPAELAVKGSGTDATGTLLLSMNGGKGAGALALMVDRSGKVIWYRLSGGEAFTLDRLPSGNLVSYQFDSQTFAELALDGTVVRTWSDARSLTGADGHDFRMLPNGNVLMFGAETHQVDSRALFVGGILHATRWDDTVSEVAPSGSVLWRWSSWGHVSESEITSDPGEPLTPRDYEVVHTNSMDPAPDGSLVLSFRNTSTVVKVDRKTGEILWRLGGKRSDFRVVGDPLDGFSRQHDARLIGLDHVLLFDNGNLHTPPESRAAEYRLDVLSKTATLVWQYRRSPPLFARIAGSVQRLPNGHTLIAWGPRGVVSEVDGAGQTIWETTTPGFGVYRARSLATPYP